MFKNLGFICLAFLLAACTTSARTEPKNNLMKHPKKIILFIPGYYGTRLKDKQSGELLWAKASNFLFSNKGLSQNIPGTNIGETRELTTDGILDRVTIVPKIFSYDAYEESLKNLQKFSNQNGFQLETLGYDWREDFISCLKVIDQKINSLNLNENDELNVVAHSMGGLLMAYYTRYGAQDVETAVENWYGLKKIKRLAFVAPPLHGLMILFRDIREGTSRGFNRELLSALDYSTFKSSYFFLPQKDEDLALNEKGETFKLNIHDIENWEKNNWGPFQFAKGEERTVVKKFVEQLMIRSQKFHELLQAPVKNQPPVKIPLLHLIGVGSKTKELASTFKTTDGKLDYKFLDAGEVDGDGTVTRKSGRSLNFFKIFDLEIKEEKDGHLEILSDKDAQSRIHKFLLK